MIIKLVLSIKSIGEGKYRCETKTQVISIDNRK